MNERAKEWILIKLLKTKSLFMGSLASSKHSTIFAPGKEDEVSDPNNSCSVSWFTYWKWSDPLMTPTDFWGYPTHPPTSFFFTAPALSCHQGWSLHLPPQWFSALAAANQPHICKHTDAWVSDSRTVSSLLTGLSGLQAWGPQTISQTIPQTMKQLPETSF